MHVMNTYISYLTYLIGRYNFLSLTIIYFFQVYGPFKNPVVLKLPLPLLSFYFGDFIKYLVFFRTLGFRI